MFGNRKDFLSGIIILNIVIGLVGVTYWFVAREDTSRQKLDPSNPTHKEMLCGPISLSCALGRLGLSYTVRELASHCEINSRGIALKELERTANCILGIKSHVRNLGWEGLRRLDGTAVLFVKGNHYIAVDPREMPVHREVDTPVVRIYEQEKPAQWMTREELESIWNGNSLILEKSRKKSHGVAGPSIEWTNCFIDKGIMEPNSTCHYTFEFRNTGSSELTINSIKKDCQCTKYTLKNKQYKPGQSGVLEAEINLRGKQGYLSSHLVVTSNDPEKPACMLRMAVGIQKTRVLSAQKIHLQDLPKGGKTMGEFYASNPGFTSFKIRDVSFVPTTELDISKHLAFSITYDLLGDDGQRAARLLGYRGKPEDYVIRFALKASEKCPVGSFQGTAIVVAEIGEAISTHTAMIKYAVVQDVHPVPGVALITLDEEGAGSATLQLRSHSEREVQIVETRADTRVPVRIERTDGLENPAGKFTLWVSMPAVVPGAAPVESAAFFKLRDGTEVRVPIAIFKPPQSGTAR